MERAERYELEQLCDAAYNPQNGSRLEHEQQLTAFLSNEANLVKLFSIIDSSQNG
jgi:hypothetical protein